MADTGIAETGLDARSGDTRLDLCGRLRFELGGRPIGGDLPGRKGRLLLAYLVLNRGRSVRRDELVDVLWPEQPPAAPEAALNTVLARLRRAVGAGVVEGRSQLDLRLPAEAWVDVEVATRRAAEAESALGAGDPRRALEAARAALAATDRPLLADFEAAWIDQRRRELEDMRVRAIEAAGRAGLALGGTELVAAEESARALIDREPYRESAYALLMEVHAARGNVAEALRVFDRLRVLLREELGTTPAARVTALHERLLLAGEGAEDGASAAGGTPADANVPGGFPRTLEVPAAHRGQAPPAFPAPLAASERRDFVGRGESLASLRAWWAEAQAGEPQLVVLGGEPGIGKTRLGARFAADAHAGGAAILYGRCDEDAALPYQPFVEALSHDVAHRRELSEDPRLDLEALGRLIPALGRHVGEWREPVPGGVETQRYRLFEAEVALLGRIARDRALLLVLDDLHWAEKPTLLMLRHVLRHSPEARLMVLGTYRDVEVGPAHALAEVIADLRREHAVHRLSLAGLDEGETAALLEARGRGAEPDRLRRLWQATRGNPFYIDETLRVLDDAAGPAASGDGPGSGLGPLPVPEGVKDMIGRRLARLGETSAQALSVAAVIGPTFSIGLLEDVLPSTPRDVLDAVEEAVAVGFLEEVEGAPGRLAFPHALVREALYEGQTAVRRLHVHHRVAEALEARARYEDVHPGELARHFFEARRLAGATKAVDYSVAAAERADHALAYEEAAAHYRRALETLDEQEATHDERRCEILLALGWVQWRAGEPGARETFEAAAASARGRRAAGQFARAALGLGRHYFENGIVDERLIALLDEALALLPDDPGPLRARLLARLAEALHFSPRREEARALSLEALETATSLGDTDTLVAALLGRMTALAHTDGLDERLALGRELLGLAERTGQQELLAEGINRRLVDLMEAGDVEEARRYDARLAQLAAALRQPLYRHYAVGWELLWARLAGRFEEAEQLVAESLAAGQQAQLADASNVAMAQAFHLRRDQGRLAELLPAVEDYVERFPALVAWRAVLPVVHLEAGEPERARAGFEHFGREGFANVPRDAFWLTAMGGLAETCTALGDAERAAILYELVRPFAHRHLQVGRVAYFGPVDRFLGLLASCMGRFGAGAEHFERALAGCAAVEAPTVTARTQCEYAEMLLRGGGEGDRSTARELLAAAGATAADFGMAGLAERARAASGRRAPRGGRGR